MLGQVIREVSRFTLVKVDQSTNSVQIHRLVQAVIQSGDDGRGTGRGPA